jgi:hypothetical protein
LLAYSGDRVFEELQSGKDRLESGRERRNERIASGAAEKSDDIFHWRHCEAPLIYYAEKDSGLAGMHAITRYGSSPKSFGSGCRFKGGWMLACLSAKVIVLLMCLALLDFTTQAKG